MTWLSALETFEAAVEHAEVYGTDVVISVDDARALLDEINDMFEFRDGDIIPE